MEHKQVEATITAVDEAQGIVEAIWAVMGNVDDVGDIIHPGAFTKTFNERKHAVKLLDNHRTDSVMSALGTVIELRELRPAELPQKMMDNSDVTGAAWGRFQFLMDTPEGKGAFTRIQKGAVKEWSFGYDAVDKDYTNKDGKAVRNLRGIKLYEVSPVLFPANSQTTTTSAKSAPSEGKPYGVVEEDGQYCVYKLDADGKPMGKPLGKHPTPEEAEAQRRALYAEEEDKATTRSEGDGQHPASHYLVVEDPEKPTTWHLRVRNASGELDHRLMGAAWAALHGGYGGNVYQGPNKQEAIAKLTRLYAQEEMDTPGDGKAMDTTEMGKMRRMMRMMGDMMTMMQDMMGTDSEHPDKSFKAGRVLNARIAKRSMDAMDNLHQCLMDAGLMEMEDDTGPHKSDDPPTPNAKGAGPNEDDSTRYLKLIELELEEMEV